MPEAASLAHMLMPVKPVNDSAGNLKSDGMPYKLRPDRADSAINDDNLIPGRPTHKTDQGPDDFDKVLSRKIDGQKEQTPDEHPHENAAPAEPAGFSPTRCPGYLAPGHENNPLGNMGEQSVPEQAGSEIAVLLKNSEDIQSVATSGVISEAMTPQNQPNTQSSARAQEVTANLTVPQSGRGQEGPVVESLTAGTELSVGEKQASVSIPAMVDSAAVSQSNETAGEQFQVPEATEQKQLSHASDSELQPLRANQDKPVHPDPQVASQGTRQEQRQGFQSQSDNPGTPDQFQDKTPAIKEPQGVPVESEAFLGEHDETPKGFEIRNVQSVLHSAEPSENASFSALEAPSRTGNHSHTPPVETAKPVDQIVQHLSSITVSGAQQRIRLTLTPEDLGTVRITFNQSEGEVVGLLEVQKNQTRREVEQALPQLISAMQSSGVQVRRIEVVQWDAGRDSAEDGTTKDPDYSAAGQFYDESSPHSSESEMSGNIRSAGGGQKSSQLSGISGLESPIEGVDTTGDGLNMFI